MPLNYKGVTLKDGLVKQCKDRNLDSSGNHLHLVQRLEADNIARANNDKTSNDNDGKDDSSNNNSDSNDTEEEEDNDHNVPDSNSSNNSNEGEDEEDNNFEPDSDNNSGKDSNEGEDEEDNSFEPSNVAARKERFVQETKEGKRICAKEARAAAKAEVQASNADYCNAGIPRKLADLVALGENLLVEKWKLKAAMQLSC